MRVLEIQQQNKKSLDISERFSNRTKSHMISPRDLAAEQHLPSPRGIRGRPSLCHEASRPGVGVSSNWGIYIAYYECSPLLAPGAAPTVSRLHMCAASFSCIFPWSPSLCASTHRGNELAWPARARRHRSTQLNSCSEGRSMAVAQQPAVGVAPLPPESDLGEPLHESASENEGGSVLAWHEDHYEGVIVDPGSLPSDVPTFKRILEVSLAFWKSQQRKGVWLKLPTKNANLVAPAIEAGFGYHHAEPSYVMLTHWIPDTPSTLPANASHQVGIGAFVMNDKQEVLAVQEKNGVLKNTGFWKMPTGLINQAEDICAGAVREVKEETGIDAEFVEVVGFRQGHQVAFEKSDLFFVCILRPLSSKIVKQDSEIAAAQWMPLEDFYAQPFIQSRGAIKQMLDVCIASSKDRYKGFSIRTLPSPQENFNFYSGALDSP